MRKQRVFMFRVLSKKSFGHLKKGGWNTPLPLKSDLHHTSDRLVFKFLTHRLFLFSESKYAKHLPAHNQESRSQTRRIQTAVRLQPRQGRLLTAPSAGGVLRVPGGQFLRQQRLRRNRCLSQNCMSHISDSTYVSTESPRTHFLR